VTFYNLFADMKVHKQETVFLEEVPNGNVMKMNVWIE